MSAALLPSFSKHSSVTSNAITPSCKQWRGVQLGTWIE
jgi:hypothetical protein